MTPLKFNFFTEKAQERKHGSVLEDAETVLRSRRHHTVAARGFRPEAQVQRVRRLRADQRAGGGRVFRAAGDNRQQRSRGQVNASFGKSTHASYLRAFCKYLRLRTLALNALV